MVVGHPSGHAEDAARVRAVRDAVGPEASIAIDANEGLHLDQAIRLVRMVADPAKSEIAFAQTYFAIQTRRAELIEQRMLEAERLGDDGGNIIPVSPDGIDALLEIWPVFEAFQTQYVAKGLILDAEKNASAPLPTGPSAGATGTARPVKQPAQTAPQD